MAAANVTVGDPVTADLLNGLVTETYSARRTSDLTRASTGTQTADTQLFITSLPAATYFRFSAMIIYAGPSNADLKFGFFVPSSGSLPLTVRAAPATLADGATTSVLVIDAQGSGGAFAAGCNGTSPSVGSNLTALCEGLLYTGVGGTVEMQWAQNTSQAVGVIVRSGSYMSLVEVA